MDDEARQAGERRIESLEAEVAELRRQLAQAQKLESIGRLASGVAHDFNNFLTVVLSNAAQLRASAEAAGDARGVRRAGMIERAGERGARLASQLLTFARKQTLFPETTAVGPLFAAMQDLLCRAAGKAAALRMRCADDTWSIRVDPAQLELALLNLVINANDAMPPGGGTITITAENVTLALAQAAGLGLPPGDFVRIGVADTGSGIVPDLLGRIFEPFFTTKEAGKGSGLGLAQVRGFVGQSGGAVEIMSEVGRGTTVFLLLPRGPAVAAAAMPEAGPGAAGAGCVLIVEDEEDLRGTARMLLEERGYGVLEATDAETACRLLADDAAPIGVLFADLILPGGMSGIELAREARRLRPDIRVLLTSGYTKDMLEQHGVGAEEFEFLLKPYSTDRLAARLARLVPGAPPPPLIWSAAHELGVREIDEQHVGLAAALNELAVALRAGEDHAAALRELVRCTGFHFAAEERLMALHRYDGAAAHLQAHRQLLREIREFRPDADGASLGVALRYLQEWLLHHVDSLDRDLAEALRARGVH